MEILSTGTENCRLCLIKIQERINLDRDIRNMLKTLLVQMSCDDCEDFVICSNCLTTLRRVHEFKLKCLDVEDKMEKTDNSLVLKFDGMLLCRTCSIWKPSGNHTNFDSFMGDELQNMIEKCLPEIDLTKMTNPNFCLDCLDLFQEQFNFIMQCLDTESKIEYYSDQTGIKLIDLQAVKSYITNLEVCGDDPKPSEDIKQIIDKKIDDEDSTEMIDTEDLMTLIATEMPKQSTQEIEETKEKPKKVRRGQPKHCPHCTQVFFRSDFFKKHVDRHKESVPKSTKTRPNQQFKMYNCSICPYKSIRRSHYQNHLAKHKTASEIKVFRCDECPFRTIRKEGLEAHKQSHVDEKNVKLKCFLCSYEPTSKADLKKHVTEVHRTKSLSTK